MVVTEALVLEARLRGACEDVPHVGQDVATVPFDDLVWADDAGMRCGDRPHWWMLAVTGYGDGNGAAYGEVISYGHGTANGYGDGGYGAVDGVNDKSYSYGTGHEGYGAANGYNDDGDGTGYDGDGYGEGDGDGEGLDL